MFPCQHFFVSFYVFRFFCIWLYLDRQPAARQRRQTPLQPYRNPAMQLGKNPERRQDPDRMRTASRHDHGHATTPGSAASSPGRRIEGPTTTPATRTAGGPAQAGQITAITTASGPGPPAPRHRQRRHDRQRHRGPDARPRSRPRHQDRPTANHSPTAPGSEHPARRHHPRRQDAHRTRHAPPYYYIHPSQLQTARTPTRAHAGHMDRQQARRDPRQDARQPSTN